VAARTGLVLVLAFSTVGLSGCSGMWNQVGKFSNFMAEETKWVKVPSLRGSKDVETTDVHTAHSTVASDSTDYVSYGDASYQDDFSYTESTAPVFTPSTSSASYAATSTSYGSSSSETVPCPEGTHLTADNACMLIETSSDVMSDTSFTDYNSASGSSYTAAGSSSSYSISDTSSYSTSGSSYSSSDVTSYSSDTQIDSSPVPCPEGTYLSDKNSCMLLEQDDNASLFTQ